MAKRKPIGFLLYEGCDLLDVSGPAEAFKFAEVHLQRQDRADPAPELFYFSPDGGQVSTAQDLPLITRPISDIAGCGLDTLIVVGSFDVNLACDPRLPACIAEHRGSIRRIAAVCTGAFVLALAGVLDGRRAVTHWADCDQLARDFPAIQVEADCIFVDDDGVWTAAGVTAGIDMALAMLEQDYGPDFAMGVARSMVVFLKRPAGDSQVSMALRGQDSSGPIASCSSGSRSIPTRTCAPRALAERAHMSLRNFYRAFEDTTRMSPAEWVEATRLEVAKRLLEQTDEYAEQVAVKAGFLTYERMRRSFARHLGVSPLAYRSRQTRPFLSPTPEIYVQSAASGTTATGPTAH
jgi:transcriptional regulator GlxA family with amidase domain